MRDNWIALLFGWVFIFAFISLASFFLTLTLTLSEISTSLFTWISFSLGITGLFIGGIIAGMKGKRKGWIFGGITGLGFTLFIFLIQYLGYQNGFSLEQSLQHLAYIAASILGGMIGVNIFQSRNKNS